MSLEKDQMYRLPEAAKRWNVSVKTARTWVAQGRVAYCRLGRGIRVPLSEVERIIADGYRPKSADGVQAEVAKPAQRAANERNDSALDALRLVVKRLSAQVRSIEATIAMAEAAIASATGGTA